MDPLGRGHLAKGLGRIVGEGRDTLRINTVTRSCVVEIYEDLG